MYPTSRNCVTSPKSVCEGGYVTRTRYPEDNLRDILAEYDQSPEKDAKRTWRLKSQKQGSCGFPLNTDFTDVIVDRRDIKRLMDKYVLLTEFEEILENTLPFVAAYVRK